MILATKLHIHNEELNLGETIEQIIRRHLKKALENLQTDYSAVQNLYLMMERDCEKEVIPYCMKHPIGVVPFSPIASGFLSGKVTTETKFEGNDVRQWASQLSKENVEHNQPLLKLIQDLASKKKATNAQFL